MQTEYQNCYSEAQSLVATNNATVNGIVARHLDAGKFVAVRNDMYHCRVTDAYVGQIFTIAKVAPTREAVEAFVATQNDDSECYHDIFPKVEAVIVPAPVEYDDCPF